jgi:hypothetical protein
MKSPFPGMDPYLEEHWGDVHQAFVTYIRDMLQPQLPEHLRARMQERVYIELPEGMRREYYPDVRIIEYPGTRSADAAAVDSGGVAVADSVLVDLDIEPKTESYVQVIDVRSGHQVVTSIEVISPTNKRAGEGKRLYLQERQDMMLGGANTVEIDLLRSGDWLLPISPERIMPAHQTTYLAWIWRVRDPNRLTVVRIPLRARLPVLPIPLRDTDAEVALDLQSILDQCYRNGGYDDIDYRTPPSPPLSDADRDWAETLIHEHRPDG